MRIPPLCLAHVSSVTRQRTVTPRVHGTQIELCLAPCLCGNTGLAGQRKNLTDLHSQRSRGGHNRGPPSPGSSLETRLATGSQCQDTLTLYCQKSTTGEGKALWPVTHIIRLPTHPNQELSGKTTPLLQRNQGSNTCWLPCRLVSSRGLSKSAKNCGRRNGRA